MLLILLVILYPYDFIVFLLISLSWNSMGMNGIGVSLTAIGCGSLYHAIAGWPARRAAGHLR